MRIGSDPEKGNIIKELGAVVRAVGDRLHQVEQVVKRKIASGGTLFSCILLFIDI